MGGKTQQRVAGNARPSSSGRIRDLLINKPGAGNIITFSTLSNREQKQPPSQLEISSQPQDKIEQNSDRSTELQAKSTAKDTSLKPTLVVRRVGNRDCFTRVRVPNADAELTNQSGLRPVSCKVGVFLPPEPDSVTDTSKPDSQLESSIELIDTNNDESDVEKSKIYDPNNGSGESCDFDSLLDRLAEYKNTSLSTTADSLIEVGDEYINQESELVKTLKKLVREHSKDMSIEEWDLVITSLQKWIGLQSRSEPLYDSKIKAEFCIDIFNLIHELALLAESWKDVKDEFPMMQSLIEDWNNFHSSDIYQDLMILFFRLTATTNPNVQDLAVIQSLANIVVGVDPKMVITNDILIDYLRTSPELEPEFELPANSRHCNLDETKFKGFLAMCNLLNSNHRVISATAHTMLGRIMDYICKNVETSTILMTEQDDADSILIFPPAALMSILSSRDSMMSALLSDFVVGRTSVTIEPNSDAYTCTLVYLLVWNLVIQFIVFMDKEIGQRVIHSLRKLELIQHLLDNIFMLLPPLGERDTISFKLETEASDVNNSRQPRSLSDFLKSPLKMSLDRPVNEIELTALHLYFSVARHMPETVRKWYNNILNRKLYVLVTKYTVEHVSPIICSLEMETVQEKCQKRTNTDKSNNLVIRARPTAREIYAVYTRDDFDMELTIILPVNYPLSPVQIEGGRGVKLTRIKWRSWLLQLTTFLAHQNGPILDGIDLWRQNIDKRFEGKEKCLICFSILNSKYQIPMKKCQTCVNMFHTSCLFKWFETSGNSTCPLCRSIW